MTLQFRPLRSIGEIPREQWDRLFPGELEGWDYYRAAEEAALADFEWLYFTLWRDGRAVLAVPAFVTSYRLDTTAQGAVRRVAGFISRLAPRLLSLRLMCLGSPVAEVCQLGIDPGAPPHEHAAWLAQLLAEVEQYAARRRIGLLGVKDAPDDSALARACEAAGYVRMPGMPTAVLPIGFADESGYLRGLSRATRKDLKRKMRSVASLRIEQREQIDDVIDQMMPLYEEMWARAELKLERLTPQYFLAVMRRMPGTALCFLYWHEDRLVAFNLVLVNERYMIDKFLGMNLTVARTLNLYYVSWMENVRFCLSRGIGLFQPGQALYREKTRMGCRLDANWQYFRHRSPPVHAVLRLLSRVMGLDRFDPHIRDLMARGR